MGVYEWRLLDIDEACEILHRSYERAAVEHGWHTNERSRKPWAEVPEANKNTMRVAVAELIDWIEGQVT